MSDETARKMTTLPDREEMLLRLMEVSNALYTVEELYPLILRYAGEEGTGPGIFQVLSQAVDKYAEGLPDIMASSMRKRIPSYIEALVDDEEVRRAGLNAFKTATNS